MIALHLGLNYCLPFILHLVNKCSTNDRYLVFMLHNFKLKSGYLNFMMGRSWKILIESNVDELTKKLKEFFFRNYFIALLVIFFARKLQFVMILCKKNVDTPEIWWLRVKTYDVWRMIMHFMSLLTWLFNKNRGLFPISESGNKIFLIRRDILFQNHDFLNQNSDISWLEILIPYTYI